MVLEEMRGEGGELVGGKGEQRGGPFIPFHPPPPKMDAFTITGPEVGWGLFWSSSK